MDPAGNALVVWYASRGRLVGNRARTRTGLRARRLDAASGTWQPPVDILMPKTRRVGSMRLAMNGRGDAIAAWTRFDVSGTRIVQTRRFSADTARWDAGPRLIHEPEGRIGWRLQLALADRGAAVVAWVARGGVRAVQATRYDPATGLWSAPVTVSGESAAYGPRIALDAAGNVLAAWHEARACGSMIRIVRFDAAVAAWQPAAVDLPSAVADCASRPRDPRVALEDDGDAVVVWRDQVEDVQAGPIGRVRTAGFRHATGAWPPAATSLAVQDATVRGAHLALGSNGTAAVAWYAYAEGDGPRILLGTPAAG